MDKDMDKDMDKGISLGDKAKDKVSGFSGVITGIATYLYSKPRIQISATVLIDGEAKSIWFDKGQVERVY